MILGNVFIFKEISRRRQEEKSDQNWWPTAAEVTEYVSPICGLACRTRMDQSLKRYFSIYDAVGRTEHHLGFIVVFGVVCETQHGKS